MLRAVVDRIARTESVLAFIEYIPRALGWLSLLGAAIVSGYAAAVTEALATYAPVSWVFAALLGALLLALVFAAGS